MWQRIEKIIASLMGCCWRYILLLRLRSLVVLSSLRIFRFREIIFCVSSMRSWVNVAASKQDNNLLHGRGGRVIGMYFSEGGQLFVRVKGSANLWAGFSLLQRWCFYCWRIRPRSSLGLSLVLTPTEGRFFSDICQEALSLDRSLRHRYRGLQTSVCLLALSDLYGFSQIYLRGGLINYSLQTDLGLKAALYNLFLEDLASAGANRLRSIFFVKSIYHLLENIYSGFYSKVESNDAVNFFCSAGYSLPAAARSKSIFHKRRLVLLKCSVPILVCGLALVGATVTLCAAYEVHRQVVLTHTKLALAPKVKYYNYLLLQRSHHLLPAVVRFYKREINAVWSDAAAVMAARTSTASLYLRDQLPRHTVARNHLVSKAMLVYYLYLYLLQHLRHDNMFLFNSLSSVPAALDTTSFVAASARDANISALVYSWRTIIRAQPQPLLLNLIARVFVSQYFKIHQAAERVEYYRHVQVLVRSRQFWGWFGVYDMAVVDKFLIIFRQQLSSALYAEIAARQVGAKFNYPLVRNVIYGSVWRAELTELFSIASVRLGKKSAAYFIQLHKIYNLLSKPELDQIAEVKNLLHSSRQSLFLSAANYIASMLPVSAPSYLRLELELPLRLLWVHFANLYVNDLNSSWQQLLAVNRPMVLYPILSTKNNFKPVLLRNHFSTNSVVGRWIIANINPVLVLGDKSFQVRKYLGIKFPLSNKYVSNICLWENFLSKIVADKSVVWRGRWRPVVSTKIAAWSANINGSKLSYVNGQVFWHPLVIKYISQQFMSVHLLTISGQRSNTHTRGGGFFVWRLLAKHARYSKKYNSLILHFYNSVKSPVIVLQSGHDADWLQLLNYGFRFPKKIN